jgi:uncharacterized membrane protein (UPF0127 family)
MQIKEISFKYKGEKIRLDAGICDSHWSRFRGLMFRKERKSIPLLFIFKKLTKTPIHSFFCKEFIALWLDEKDNVMEFKKIKPWNPTIIPKKSFVKLVEIPVNKKYLNVINNLYALSSGRKV